MSNKTTTTTTTTLAPPPSNASVLLSNPGPHVLLVTINRERQMNSIPFTVHWHLHRVFEWFDREPSLRVAVVTGAGSKAFCAGQDLIELGKRDPKELEEKPYMAMHPPTGFAGISRRLGKKPVIAAVNGFALGGGFEIVLNWYVVLMSFYIVSQSFLLGGVFYGKYSVAPSSRDGFVSAL